MDRAIRHADPSCSRPPGGRDALLAAVAQRRRRGLPRAAGAQRAPRRRRTSTLEELAEATRYAHLRGARVYLTANILVLADEMPAALATVDDRMGGGRRRGDRAGSRPAAADPRASCPTCACTRPRRSTRTTPPTVAALADLGVARVTLARETVARRDRRAGGRARRSSSRRFVHGACASATRASASCRRMIGGALGQPRAVRAAVPPAVPARRRARARDDRAPARYLLSPKDLAGITVLPRPRRAPASRRSRSRAA